MSITWMPDDQSGMKRYADTTVEEFLTMNPGWNIQDVFTGPGMYMVNDGKLSKHDIKEGLTSSPGKCIGTIIVR